MTRFKGIETQDELCPVFDRILISPMTRFKGIETYMRRYLFAQVLLHFTYDPLQGDWDANGLGHVIDASAVYFTYDPLQGDWDLSISLYLLYEFWISPMTRFKGIETGIWDQSFWSSWGFHLWPASRGFSSLRCGANLLCKCTRPRKCFFGS